MARRFPDWMRKRIPSGGRLEKTRLILNELHLNTVCQEALCPNQGECFAKGTATFMILGEVCTRNCRFCAVGKGVPQQLDPDEPSRVAEAAYQMGLKHVVVTSVTRDDLEDGGADHFALTIKAIRSRLPQTTIEVLTPDFGGDEDELRVVVEARPDVFNHNVETVPSLYSKVRPQANYRRSLGVLEAAKRIDEGTITKSGIMVGLGETADEVGQVMRDLRGVGCEFITIGQYLSPSKGHLPVVEFVTPEVFEEYERYGYEMGFSSVASGPFVRSSYNAGEYLRQKREVYGE